MVTFTGFFLMCCAITEIVSASDYSRKLKRESSLDGLNSGSIQPNLYANFVPRKCCKIGQVYQLGHGIKRCTNTTDSNWTSLFNQNSDTDIIATGLPQNCSENDLMLLQPKTVTADRFILLPNGQLILPRRFWILSPDDYCTDDLISENNSMEKRIVLICTNQIKEFHPTATDSYGRLRPSSHISDKMIVHKCCDLHEAFLINNLSCIPNEGYSTQFLNQLQENDNYFLQITPIACRDQHRVEYFQITSTGQLQMYLDDELRLIAHPDDYCLDDMVLLWDDELPEVVTLVNYCPNSNKSLTLAPESDFVTTKSESVNQVIVDIPKCCPKGQIINGKGCQNFKLLNQEAMILRAFHSHISAPNETFHLLANYSSLAYENAKEIELNYSLTSNQSWITPIFERNANGNVSFYLHYFKKNFWDYKIQVDSFCLEIKISERSNDYLHHPKPIVLYWTSSSHDPGYLVYLHLSSGLALLLTIWIYSFVPAPSSAKFVTSGSGRLHRSRVMACTLTGRNLICYSISMAVTFFDLAVVELEIYPPGESVCVGLGYLLYGSLMASFSWSTVYCFDYVWMFRGSFQFSDSCKFIPYSIFGWGIPVILISISYIAQFYSPEVTGFPQSLNPNIGLVKCFFADGRVSRWFLVSGPIFFLLGLNIIFFIILLLNPNLMNCFKKKNPGPQLRTNRAKPHASPLKKYKADVKMALRLFFITGIPWIFEVLYSFFPITFLFHLNHLLTSLRGVIIFIFFIPLQRNVRRHLQLRLRKCFPNLKRKDSRSQSIDSLSQVNTEVIRDIYNITLPSLITSTSGV